MQNYMKNFRQRVSPFAARFSGAFGDVEAPGDNSVNTKNLPRMKCTRSVPVCAIVHALLDLELHTMNLNVGPVYTYFIT